MSLSAGDRTKLERIESTAARKGFNLADLIESAVRDSVLAFPSIASSGGSASEAMTFTGVLATDQILAVTQVTPGAGVGKTMIAHASLVNDALTITWDANPGTGAIILLSVLRI